MFVFEILTAAVILGFSFLASGRICRNEEKWAREHGNPNGLNINAGSRRK